MKNINILLTFLLIASSITTLNLKSAARIRETNENIQPIDSNILIQAINHNEKELATKLIHGNQINLNFKDSNGQTALYLASGKGFTKIVKLLLKFNANVNDTNNNNWTPLMSAVNNGKIDTVQLLLDHGASVNNKAVDGTTALMIASKKGFINIAKLLLKFGANVNSKSLQNATALMFASRFGFNEVVKLLLEHNAHINMKEIHGWTALMFAANNDKTDVVKLLLDYNADMNVNKHDETALAKATRKGFTIIANAIKDKEIINEFSEKIFKAYEEKDIKSYKLHLKNFKKKFPADQIFVLLKDKENNSLLHQAIIKKDYALIDYILKYNPKVLSDLLSMPNIDGMTPIDLAVSDESLLKYFMNFAYPQTEKSSCCNIL